MAKAVRYHKQGGPEVLQLDDVQVGDPGHAVRRATRGEQDVHSGLEGAVNGVVDPGLDLLICHPGTLDPLEQGAVDFERDQARGPVAGFRGSLRSHLNHR